MIWNPDHDAERVTRVREALGEDIWLAVDANQRYDYGTALSMGHFFEEEIGADWFEEPIHCEDVEGHARLADRLEVPIAGGESLFGLDEFAKYLERSALEVVQPDVTRVAGGQMIPPKRPGLGLEIRSDAIERYRVEF